MSWQWATVICVISVCATALLISAAWTTYLTNLNESRRRTEERWSQQMAEFQQRREDELT